MVHVIILSCTIYCTPYYIPYWTVW